MEAPIRGLEIRARSASEPDAVPSGSIVLDVQDLHTHFGTRAEVVRAVNGVSFTVAAGTSLGMIGESGSGKSVTSLSIMRLIEPPGYVASGRILFNGTDIASLSEREIRAIRGRSICLVFQDPMTALNPVYTVGQQVAEAVLAHQEISRRDAMDRAIELFRMVGIPAPEQRVHEYPHKLSGGMRQRVTIAIALANKPDLLILDEPTTALDVTVQAQILDLIRDLRQHLNTAVLLITHDFGVVKEICDHVVVMYGGRIMERGTVEQVTRAPRHPYTVGLVSSIPTPAMRGKRLISIAGSVPSSLRMPPGCPFQPRCPKAMDVCSTAPGMRDPGDGRGVACWLY
jgi:oligopeptide/dipeptide ABC transporter ATP-binding protein